MNHTKRIYMIGICGVAMGTLAGMLKERGFSVRGSDTKIYPPMSDMLSKWGVECFDGFDASRIAQDDLVIIGNAISRGNVEAEKVLSSRIEYLSMTEALYRFFLNDKEVIAVCGTHGKTTTTALLSHILRTAGEDPSCFVGGVMKNYDSNFFLGSGKYFVIEGDEYDSAFFEKTPKFIRYRPSHLVLTALEFDHADIYGSLDEIVVWFARVVNMIPSNGRIIWNRAYPALATAVAKSFSLTSDFGNGSRWGWRFDSFDDAYDRITITDSTRPDFALEVKTLLSGEFNYANICSAAAMALELGIDEQSVRKGIETFEGVKRRQELIFSSETVKVYEDFAHHPTAIAGVLAMMRRKFAGRRIIGLFEPRSATARRNVFQDSLPGAFRDADLAILKTPYMLEKIPADRRLDISKVEAEIRRGGRDVYVSESVADIAERICATVADGKPSVVVIMSNGGFEGIYDLLKAKLSAGGSAQGSAK